MDIFLAGRGVWTPFFLDNTRRTIHPSIHSRRPCVPCGRCTCLEFLATQCSIHVVAGILLSTSKDSPVHCVISSLTLNAVLELTFVQCPCNGSAIASLKSYSFIYSFIHSIHLFIHSLIHPSKGYGSHGLSERSAKTEKATVFTYYMLLISGWPQSGSDEERMEEVGQFHDEERQGEFTIEEHRHPRRRRSFYTQCQLAFLEAAFSRGGHYPSQRQREQIARTLNVTESRVQVSPRFTISNTITSFD